MLGLAADATAAEVAAYGEPVGVSGTRARALAMLAAYKRFEQGEKFADVAADVPPVGDTVPRWTMPEGEPVDVLPRDLVAGDIVAGVWDRLATMRTLSRSIVGPVTAAPVEYDRREAGEWVTVTVDGEPHEVRSFRWFAVHRVGTRPVIVT